VGVCATKLQREPFRPCLSSSCIVSTPTQPDDISAAKKLRLEILISVLEMAQLKAIDTVTNASHNGWVVVA
jgi:hypothetical protein